VHKVSNLILSITLVEMEAGPAGGARRAVHSAEIRGNTDDSWLRGLRWLLRNRLLRESAALTGASRKAVAAGAQRWVGHSQRGGCHATLPGRGRVRRR
jgi:hypothetical protein